MRARLRPLCRGGSLWESRAGPQPLPGPEPGLREPTFAFAFSAPPARGRSWLGFRLAGPRASPGPGLFRGWAGLGPFPRGLSSLACAAGTARPRGCRAGLFCAREDLTRRSAAPRPAASSARWATGRPRDQRPATPTVAKRAPRREPSLPRRCAYPRVKAPRGGASRISSRRARRFDGT